MRPISYRIGYQGKTIFYLMPHAHEGVRLHFHQDHDAQRMVYVGKVDELWNFEIIIHLHWHTSFATPECLLCLPKVVPFHALPYFLALS